MTTRRPNGQGFPWRRLSIVLAASALGAAPDVSHAALIDVGPQCSLRDALASAESDLPVSSGCVQGSGADTVRLPPNSVQTLTSPLPEISNDLVIEGRGSTIRRAEGASPFRILTLRAPAVVELRGLTISNGDAGTDSGGGVLNQAQLTMVDCVVTGNLAGSGGGIKIDGDQSQLTLRNSLIADNHVLYSGGGISSTGDLFIYDSTIIGNRLGATDGESESVPGAGVDFFGSRAVILRSTVTGNSAESRESSGISVYAGSLEIRNSTVSGNDGTGVWSRYSSTVIADSTIAKNFYGVRSYYGPLDLQRSIISGNLPRQVKFIPGDFGTDIPTVFSRSNVFGSAEQTSAQAFRGFSPSASDILATSDGTAPTPLAGILLPTLALNGGATPTHALPAGSPAIDGVDTDCAETDQRGVTRAQNLGCDIGAFELETIAAAGPTLSFTASLSPAPESGGRVNTVLQLSEPAANDVQALVEIRGTAQPADFRVPRSRRVAVGDAGESVLTTQVLIRAGRTEAVVPVILRNDRIDEPEENVVLRLVSTEGAETGSRSLSRLVIEDGDRTPVINFQLAKTSAGESTPVRNLRVVLSNPSHVDLTADLEFDGTASRFVDYDAPDRVTIPAGKTSALVPINLIDDDEVEPVESIQIRLGSFSDENDVVLGNVEVGPRAQHTLRIRSDD